jgi:hypothetical protein
MVDKPVLDYERPPATKTPSRARSFSLCWIAHTLAYMAATPVLATQLGAGGRYFFLITDALDSGSMPGLGALLAFCANSFAYGLVLALCYRLFTTGDRRS